MLPGLTPEEFKDTLFSVGSHRESRFLSPVEVAVNFDRALAAGASTSDLTREVHLSRTMVRRFLKLLQLHPDVQYLVDWGGSGDGMLSFSSANKILELSSGDQARLAAACIKHQLIKSETISVVQLRERSGRDLNDCVADVVSRRKRTVVREVVIGSITNELVREGLRRLRQSDRDQLLTDFIRERYSELRSFRVRLAPHRYTIVGGKDVGREVAPDTGLTSAVVGWLGGHLSGLGCGPAEEQSDA